MRLLVIALVVVIAARSAFAVVIFEPPIVRACPEQASWDAVGACLVKHGFRMQVVKQTSRARLLHVDEPRGDGTRVALGYVLYVLDKGSWKLGGLYEQRDVEYELLGFEIVTVRKFSGFRFDVGFSFASTLSLDGDTTQPSYTRMKTSVYCSGESWSCVENVTACDVLVHGQVYFTYRGIQVVDDNAQVHNSGAREVGGTCLPPEKQFLGWPVTN